MPEKTPESRLCEICKKVEATVHLSEVSCEVSVEGDKTKSSVVVTHDYCEQCANSVGIETPEAESCHYCGGQPAGGQPNIGPALAVRKKKWHWTCHRCGSIEHRFMIKEMRKIPPHVSEQENEARLEDIYRQAEDYVREALISGEKEESLPPITGEIVVPERVSTVEVASLIGKKTHEVISDLMLLDVFILPDEPLPFDTVSKVLRAYGYIAKRSS
jgi:hypothetical protein